MSRYSLLGGDVEPGNLRLDCRQAGGLRLSRPSHPCAPAAAHAILPPMNDTTAIRA